MLPFGGGGVSFQTVKPGQRLYSTPGNYNWVCPPGVYSVCVVAVGHGGSTAGGGGGGLGWKNNIRVTPGQSYTVVVPAAPTAGALGSSTYFISTSIVSGQGPTSSVGGSFTGDGGGNGGNGTGGGGGGGGAGGYTGPGGNAGNFVSVTSGGGAGGGSDSGGGGVGLNGKGANPTNSSQGGSGGTDATRVKAGDFGGGAPGAFSGGPSATGKAGLRIIWGVGRAFPSTKTQDL